MPDLPINLHLVGGFLGSGKSTAIVAAARRLLSQGLRLGIVTNDQGRYLVDTAFARAADLPTVEVNGGCFCCNYEDFSTVLGRLKSRARPQVVFAESVGSCADLVATVVRPLHALGQAPDCQTTLSVLADIRLLRRRLLGQTLPFSDGVLYLFDKQIEEAGCLLINKTDLLPTDQVEHTLKLAEQAYPDKTVLCQSALAPNDTQAWLSILEKEQAPLRALDIDYPAYGAAEAELAWLDAELACNTPDGQGPAAIELLLETMSRHLAAAGRPIGHLKLWFTSARSQAKISLTALNDPAWRQQIPDFSATGFSLLVNLRAQASGNCLAEALEHGIAALRNNGIGCRTLKLDAFSPAFPVPTHRLV